MKTYIDKKVAFVCDNCKKVAGKDDYEEEALSQARNVARNQDWEWKHPGWQLYCDRCK